MQQEIDDLINKHQIKDPQNSIYTGKMLWTVWSDGELTLQKAGELWGRRTEHLIEFGTKKDAYYELPNKMNGWTFVVVDEDDIARKLRNLLI